jgi:hypothetical protein
MFTATLNRSLREEKKGLTDLFDYDYDYEQEQEHEPVTPGAYGKKTPNAERRTSNAELAQSEFDVQRSTLGVRCLLPP